MLHVLLRRCIGTGKPWEELPPRIKSLLTPQEYRSRCVKWSQQQIGALQHDLTPKVLHPRVKEYCIQRGLSWASSLASAVCNEQVGFRCMEFGA